MALSIPWAGLGLRYAQRRIGQKALAALLVLILASAILAAWSWSLGQNMATLSQDMARAEVRLQERQKGKPQGEDPMAAMLRQLPTRAEINETLFRLQHLASEQHVTLADAEYDFSAAEPPLGGRLRVRFRTRASYIEARNFLRAAQDGLPALALARVSFDRQRIGDTRLDTVLEFVLYFREVKA